MNHAFIDINNGVVEIWDDFYNATLYINSLPCSDKELIKLVYQCANEDCLKIFEYIINNHKGITVRGVYHFYEEIQPIFHHWNRAQTQKIHKSFSR